MSNAGWDKSSVRALERRSAPGIGAKIPQEALPRSLQRRARPADPR